MSQTPNVGGGMSSGPQPGYEAWYEQPQETRLSIMAVLSLVFSILCLTAPIGVILGVAALFMIGASRGRTHGKGLAISGIVIGLVCSTCLTFVLVGGISTLQMASRFAIKPAGDLMADIEAKNYTSARSRLSAKNSTQVTDAEFEAFRTAYQAELGSLKNMPSSLIEMISIYQQAQGALNAFNRDFTQTGQNQNIIPLTAQFDKGAALIGVHIHPQGGRGQSPDKGLPIDNLLIITNSGKSFWLHGSASAEAIQSSGTPPGKPETPATPEAPAKPEPPAGGN